MLRTLRSFSGLSHPFLTNNGLELSWNDRIGLFSLGRSAPRDRGRVQPSGGSTRFVVNGLEPTLSPDGSSLAYLTDSSTERRRYRSCIWTNASVAAREPCSTPLGRTTSFRRRTRLAWFDHGSKLAVLASPAPVAISSPQSPRTPIAVTPPCATRSATSEVNCLAVISIGGAPLRLEDIQAQGSFGIYSGGSSAPSDIISDQLEQRDSRLTG